MTEMPVMTEDAPLGVPEFDLADRLRKALRESGVTVQAMADYQGVARNTVGTWINGHNKPSPQAIRLWAMRTDVNHMWLKTGKTGPAGKDGIPVGTPRRDNVTTGYSVRRVLRPLIVPQSWGSDHRSDALRRRAA